MPRIFTVLCLLVVAACAAPPPAVPAHPIRVLTYNIRIGLGGADPALDPYPNRRHEKDLAPVTAAIGSVKADVVALQEVLGENQAAAIAKALAMEFVYARHGAKYGKWWGLAVLSRLPIAASESLAVSEGRGNTRRDLLVRLRAGDAVLNVVDTHADKDVTDGSVQRRTMANLAAVTGPLVLLGDFNARPEAKRLGVVRARLTDAAETGAKGAAHVRAHSTFRQDGTLVKGKRIDYIFIDAKRIAVDAVGLLDRAHWPASDHIGVHADIRILPE